MANALVWTLIVLIALVILVAIFAKFYQRATQEVSLVKTGFGGRKVIMDKGTIAIPWFHEVSKVNMQTLRLEVQRGGEAALITKDRLRVDIGAEFYVSVVPSADGISRAAQTLGNRTFNPDQLRELIEGKLVDSLRSVAARFTMDELHENRGAFVSEVRESLADSMASNGLELDSVSLTGLDQTPFSALDDNNAFNAVGMRKLAEVIAKSKKERAEIDADAEVSVRRAAMEATKRKLQIDLEEQEAEIAQVEQIESMRAKQIAELAKRKADSERDAAQARIEMEKQIQAADIARERAIREAEISNEREIALASQEREISLAEKSREQIKAKAAADMAKADAVKAAEAISTAKELAEAERRKDVALVAAEQDGMVAGNRVRMSATAERDAASDRAAARLEEARADAEAAALRTAAKKEQVLAEAEGQEALAQAANALNGDAMSLKVDMARLDALPKVVAEMVKPAERIDSIKIHHVTGLNPGGGTGEGAAATGEKPVVNQAVESILDMAVQLPALKKIGEELGISVDSGLAGLSDELSEKRGKNKSGSSK